MPLQRDLLVLAEQSKLRVEVVDLVECRLKRNLSLLDANVQLPLLLQQNLENRDVRIHVVRHMVHLRIR